MPNEGTNIENDNIFMALCQAMGIFKNSLIPECFKIRAYFLKVFIGEIMKPYINKVFRTQLKEKSIKYIIQECQLSFANMINVKPQCPEKTHMSIMIGTEEAVNQQNQINPTGKKVGVAVVDKYGEVLETKIF